MVKLPIASVSSYLADFLKTKSILIDQEIPDVKQNIAKRLNGSNGGASSDHLFCHSIGPSKTKFRNKLRRNKVHAIKKLCEHYVKALTDPSPFRKTITP